MPHKIRLHISYDGTDFAGWQRQKSGPPTVQGCLEQALSRVLNEPIKLCAAGRTDAGVHALGQVAHCRTTKEPHRYNLTHALNGLTPPGVVVKAAFSAPADFHAIASSTCKIYRYMILNSPQPSALGHRYMEWQRRPLNIDYLNEISAHLIGEKDFKSFQTTGTELTHTIRHIQKVQWRRRSNHVVEFSILGNGFLKQMVRNIVGTCLDLHYQKAETSRMLEILAAHDRSKAGTTAPPQGLYLWRVFYPADLDKRCRKI